MMNNFSNTALVIGAGAHHPYGMPTASELSEEIKSLRQHIRPGISIGADASILSSDENKRIVVELGSCIHRMGVLALPEDANQHTINATVFGYLKDFIDRFAKSRAYSIDAFLARPRAEGTENERSIEAAVGKIVIAFLLRRKQWVETLQYRKADWIDYIINEFFIQGRYVDQFFETPPLMITFNYDNVLEHTLYNHLTAHQGWEPKRAREAIGQLNIIHVYGQVPTFEHEESDDQMRAALKSIRVVGEERDHDAMEAIQSRIGNELSSCSKIYFLGFGFDKTNLNVIFNKSFRWNTPQKLLSTNIRLTERRKTETNQFFGQNGKSVHFYEKNEVDCLELISARNSIFAAK